MRVSKLLPTVILGLTAWMQPQSILCEEFVYSPIRLYPSYTAGQWLDNRWSYSTVNFFSILPSCMEMMPFVEMKGHFFNNGRIAANVGGGFRCEIADFIIGANCFYDYRQGSWNHGVQQVGCGIEFLSGCIDIRSNGYFPISKTAHSRKHVYTFDQYEATCREEKQAGPGFDFEVGKWMCTYSCWNFYGAVGTYYFSQKKSHHQWGVQARVKSKIGEYVSIELKGGYDPFYKGMFSATINLENIFDWFKDCCYDPCQNPLYQPIERKDLIVLGRKCCSWTWNWDSPPQDN